MTPPVNGAAPVHCRTLSPPAAVGRRGGRVPEAQVITVTGPRDAATLGVIDAHDHLLIDSPGMPGAGFTDVERSIEEARDGLASGISTLVEMTPIGLGRRPRRAARDRRGHGARRHRRERLPPRRPLPRRLTGSTRRRSSSWRPDRRPTSRVGMHPRRLARPVAAARRGPGGRDQGRRVLSPHHAAPSGAGSRRSAARRRRPARPSSSTPRSGRRPTRSSTCW